MVKQVDKTTEGLDRHLKALEAKLDEPTREIYTKDLEVEELSDEVKKGLLCTGEQAIWLFSDPLKIAWKLQFLTMAVQLDKIMKKFEIKERSLQLLEMAFVVALCAISAKLGKIEIGKALQLGMQAFVALQLTKLVKKIGDIQLIAQMCWKEINHVTHSITLPSGNQLSVTMKVVEKLAYIESRIMAFFWEDSEITRQMANFLSSWTSSERQLKASFDHLRDTWSQARSRLGDLRAEDRQPKWTKLVDDAIDKELDSISSWLEFLDSENGSETTKQQKQELLSHKMEILSLRTRCQGGQRGAADDSAGGDGGEITAPAPPSPGGAPSAP